MNAARPIFCCELVSNELRENIFAIALYLKSKCNTLRSGAVIQTRAFFFFERITTSGEPCMKDTSRLFEWILVARRLNRAISYHLPIRNAASVHLDSNNSGACRPDHVYFRPPPPSPLCMKTPEHCAPTKERYPPSALKSLRGSRLFFFFCRNENVRSRAKRVKGAETCPLFLSGHSALLRGLPPCRAVIVTGLEEAERLW